MLAAFNIGDDATPAPLQWDPLVILDPLMDPNTLPKRVLNGPFTPYVSKHDGNDGMLQWMGRYGEIGIDNRITGLEYCPTDDTVIISGYGLSYSTNLQQVWVAKISNVDGGTIDTWVHTSPNNNMQSMMLSYKSVDQTDWFYLGYTVQGS